jgi:enoyl-CoA hydratase
MYTLEDSLAAGLMDEVVDQDLLMSAVNEKAQDLATMGHPSYSMTKELFIADPMSKINTAMEELKNNS